MKFFVAFVLLVSAVGVYSQNFGAELANLDFKNIIGGPLQAVIQAQALSSKTTTDFINDVGLYVDANGRNTVRMVSFDYAKVNTNTSLLQNFSLSIPFIMLMPVPYIEVNIITIDLNVKLNSVQTTSSGNTLSTYGEVSGGYGWFFGSVSFKSGFSTTSTSTYTGTTQQAFDLSVHVQAGQAALPAGTSKVLDMLESIIRETPVNGTNSP